MPRSAVEVCVWMVEENDRGHESGDKTDGDRLDTDPARRSAWGFAKCEKGHSDRALDCRVRSDRWPSRSCFC